MSKQHERETCPICGESRKTHERGVWTEVAGYKQTSSKQFWHGGCLRARVAELEAALAERDEMYEKYEKVREWAERESFPTPRFAHSDEYLEARIQIRAIIDAHAAKETDDG